MDGWMDGWGRYLSLVAIDGWMDGWGRYLSLVAIDGWMDGWIGVGCVKN
jgi:hypothetical protein